MAVATCLLKTWWFLPKTLDLWLLILISITITNFLGNITLISPPKSSLAVFSLVRPNFLCHLLCPGHQMRGCPCAVNVISFVVNSSLEKSLSKLPL